MLRKFHHGCAVKTEQSNLVIKEYECQLLVDFCVSETSAFHFQVSGRQKLHSDHFQLMPNPVAVASQGECRIMIQS